MIKTKTIFDALEAFAFILPALPDNLWIRLLILVIYFIAHYNKLQYEYLKIKKDIITRFETQNAAQTDKKDDSV
uniref:Uncharacterized protein n=1 Tax=viral metagenome TaxID=1070528 RepID=A0A6C0JMM7_9ZZZZ